MSTKRTGKTSHEILCDFGEKLADGNHIPPTELRYASYVFHNGRQWTLKNRWERLVDNQWVEMPDEWFPRSHSCP